MGIFGRKKTNDQRLAEMIKGVEVPSFREEVLETLRLLRDPESSLQDVARVVERDPGLVVRLLAAVNAAAFGPAKKIENVGHAVSYLGRGSTEQVVLAVAVKDALPKQRTAGYDPERFWRAAGRRAALARSIAAELHPSTLAESYTVGLLQDMALPLLAHARPTEYGPLLEAWHSDPREGLDGLEQRVLGFDHSEVGDRLGRQWGLPERLTRAIGCHHDDSASDELVPPAVRLVAVLPESEGGHERFVEHGRTNFGLDPDWLHGLAKRAAAA